MRPPAAATMRSVKRCYPKMSKKEKRFDPSKAPIPVPMVEPPISQLFIYQNIPHRSFEYYRGTSQPLKTLVKKYASMKYFQLVICLFWRHNVEMLTK